MDVPITITALPPPTLASVTPTTALPGQTVDVTISGGYFCGASLSTGYTGLSLSALAPVEPATVINAVFTIASNASPGIATVVITTPRGTVSFPFTIASSNPPSITSVSPTSGCAGSNTLVTIAGTNLQGASLNTSYTGLSFSSVTANSEGTSLSAQFNVSPTAAVGTATITLTTPADSTAFSFSITAGPCGSTSPSSNKEFVYLGGRMIAMEAWSASTQPPGAPQQFTAQVLSQTTVQLSWLASTPAPNTNITAYQVKRAGTVIATLPPSQLSWLDTTASQGSTYTFNAVAKDNTIPAALVSANSNSVSVSTPQETIPPTAPTNVYGECGWLDEYTPACAATWSPSTDSGGSGLRGYQVVAYGPNWQILVGPDGGASNDPNQITTTGTSMLFGWPDGIQGVRVYARDNAGNVSAPGTFP